ncbi:fibronectin type III domain-containing protein [Streptomyces sp. NPDC058372]|uniref:fibronectin type III domain-containing protein n=1 Tax=Streptomyces sp. NPDC058372 TaxID=3346464 RepID=UPI00364692A9
MEPDRPPSAPTGVTAVAGSATSVHVMWNQSTDDQGVRRYDVLLDGKKVKEVPAERHMVDITGLRPGTAHAFTVRALDSAGNEGPASKRVAVTTPKQGTEDTRPPAAPSGLTAEAGGSRAATLIWKAAEDDAVASYDIYQGSSKIHSVGGDSTSAVVTGLRPGTAYRFTVKARDAAGNVSPASPEARLTTSGKGSSEAGAAPTELVAAARRTDEGHYIDLTWVAPRTGGEVTEYQIRLDGKQDTSLVWGGKVPEEAKYSFFVGKEAGVKHRVKLRAKLPDGTWGGFSPERTVVTGEE